MGKYKWMTWARDSLKLVKQQALTYEGKLVESYFLFN